MNKQDLISKIKQLDGVTQDERAYLINLVNTKKKYGLVWEDKPEDVEEQLRDNLPVLKEVKEKAIINGEDNPNHILIEGDNLHALTALTFTHEGKIDVIYIDPPYNTGNKDFKYNDSFVDKEDSYRHSKWLSFMDKRLRIAKQLLSDNGAIFISIDDYEVGQLKLICNEIFGESNFVGQWNWFKSATPPNLSHKIKKNVEFILGYEKNKNNTKYKGIQKDSKSDDPITKPQNTLKVLTFPPKTINFKNENFQLQAGIYGTEKYPNKLLNDLIVENYTNTNEVSFENRFVWTQPKLDEELANSTIINCSKTTVISYKKQNYSEEVPPNLIDESVGVDTTEEAGKSLYEIFGEKMFDYPKPVSLIKYLLSFKENSIILDFFAGSGTTLHATMELNAEDGGNRQSIIITNNEIDAKTEKDLLEKGIEKGTEEFENSGICQAVTYERNKRVIEGYTNTKGIVIEGLKNNNLRYFKSEFVPSSKTEQNKRLLTQASTELICIKEDCYQDVTEKDGFNRLHCGMFTNGKGKYLVVVYHTRQINAVCEQLTNYIKGLEITEKVKLYAFSPEKETLLEDFYDVQDKIDAVPLPEAIYNAYRATFRTLKLDKKPMVVITITDDVDGESTLFDNQDEE
ncbi:site-specific DNA-methyltransferase [Flavobacterium sp.]|uniref:site-specific DNA-methyltransferase n=1 Tax=Flavobacterium sp. TaxID=239 RepID=UPI00286DB573|nr:site-specific DNA-methyltransferase [Flavobacterium sp.]